jgi:carboxypeptidase C (cathepsin A)
LLRLLHAQDKNSADKNIVVTKHQIKVGAVTINYTATAGFMLMKDENDSLKAKVFFVAYTKNGEKDTSKRPILFAYNGGPWFFFCMVAYGRYWPGKRLC